jgi:esterase
MKIFHREIGSGPPLVMLHGLLGMSDNLMSVARVLGAKFRVILLDHRNHGRSDHHPDFGYDAMANDLLELLDSLNIYQVSLIGHSMGGKVAIKFAYDNPGLVNKLVVVDISPTAYARTTEHQTIIDEMTAINLAQYSNRNELELVVRQKFGGTYKEHLVLKNIALTQSKTLAWKCNLAAIKENLAKILGEILPAARFHKPTLFVKGANSNYIQPHDEDLIRQHFSNVLIKTISNAGHLVHADNPAGFIEVVEGFLEG